MLKHKQLFEFLCKLIDIQIDKYVALTKIGVGPDAGMNARLVHDQTEELFSFAEEILTDLENFYEEGIWHDDSRFTQLFLQTKFYLDQEYLRGRAAWLIDENNIHSSEFLRLQQQKELLTFLAKFSGIEPTFTPAAKTDVQKQCEHDSHEIAYLVLDLAIRIKSNPQTILPGNIPAHAANILRKHAKSPSGRYHNEVIWADIRELYIHCQNFLKHSHLTKSTDKFIKEQAKLSAEQHYASLQSMLDRYKKIEPDADLFSDQHEWYVIGRAPKASKAEPISAHVSVSLFSAKTFLIGAISAAAICGLIYWLCQSGDFKINLSTSPTI